MADQMMRSSQRIADAWRTAGGPLAVPATAFGDGLAAAATAHTEVVDEGDVALGRLVAVLEGDVDRLYRIAFAYKKADDDAAAKVRRQHRNIPI